MRDLESAIKHNREAVNAFLDAARAVPESAWTEPRSPGKWSPAQVTEHVAIAYEVARDILNGTFTGRGAPRLLRPLIRSVFLSPILRTGRFKKGTKAPASFQPTASPASVEELSVRMQEATQCFETDLEAAVRAGRTIVNHPVFGRVALSDYLRLQAIHTGHHSQQLRPGTAI